jgi:hypothetical protein
MAGVAGLCHWQLCKWRLIAGKTPSWLVTLIDCNCCFKSLAQICDWWPVGTQDIETAATLLEFFLVEVYPQLLLLQLSSATFHCTRHLDMSDPICFIQSQVTTWIWITVKHASSSLLDKGLFQYEIDPNMCKGWIGCVEQYIWVQWLVFSTQQCATQTSKKL